MKGKSGGGGEKGWREEGGIERIEEEWGGKETGRKGGRKKDRGREESKGDRKGIEGKKEIGKEGGRVNRGRERGTNIKEISENKS